MSTAYPIGAWVRWVCGPPAVGTVVRVHIADVLGEPLVMMLVRWNDNGVMRETFAFPSMVRGV